MTNLATRKVPFTFNLDEITLLKIKQIAKNDTRSASNLIEHLCKICVKEFESQNGEININEDE